MVVRDWRIFKLAPMDLFQLLSWKMGTNNSNQLTYQIKILKSLPSLQNSKVGQTSNITTSTKIPCTALNISRSQHITPTNLLPDSQMLIRAKSNLFLIILVVLIAGTNFMQTIYTERQEWWISTSRWTQKIRKSVRRTKASWILWVCGHKSVRKWQTT